MENKTFKAGPDHDFNACVGHNTGGASTSLYIEGFGKAVKALITVAKEEVLPGVDDVFYMDTLILPIGFCYRHYIELFLKSEIITVARIRKIYNKEECKSIVKFLNKTHDLKSLWEKLEGLCKVDVRLEDKLVAIKEYVDDVYNVDSDGQAFRYRVDLDGKVNLSSLSVINLLELKSRFDEVYILMRDFLESTSEIFYEYGWGTYTEKLSRAELKELAKLLPKKADWDSYEFSECKSEILEMYKNRDFSSNDFSKALGVIQKHREFSSLICVEIPISPICADTFERVRNFNLITSSDGEFSIEELASLSAIYDVGMTGEYSEAYDLLYKEATSVASSYEIEIVCDVRKIKRFRKGLVSLGQKTLLADFDKIFPSEV